MLRRSRLGGESWARYGSGCGRARIRRYGWDVEVSELAFRLYNSIQSTEELEGRIARPWRSPFLMFTLACSDRVTSAASPTATTSAWVEVMYAVENGSTQSEVRDCWFLIKSRKS